MRVDMGYQAIADQAIQRRARDLSAFSTITRIVNQYLDLDALLAAALDEIMQLDLYDKPELGIIFLYNVELDKLEPVVVLGKAADSSYVDYTLWPGVCLCGQALEEEWLLVSTFDEYDALHQSYGSDSRLHSNVSIPLKVHNTTLGILYLSFDSPVSLNEADITLLEIIVDQLALAIENTQLRNKEQEQRTLYERSCETLIMSEKLVNTGRLTASLAHEINNPLQALHNSLQVMLSYPLGDEERLEYLHMADEEVERLIAMVNRILDFARSSQHRVSPIDVNDVINKVLTLAKKYLQHHKIELDCNLTPDMPALMANAGELGQVFLNLVMNAVEAMEDGGRLQVTSRKDSDEGIVVAFSDTGTGIPQDVLERIFDPFYSTKENGNGLGLSISQSLIHRHSGDIRVDTSPGQGTTFSIWLPYSKETVKN